MDTSAQKRVESRESELLSVVNLITKPRRLRKEVSSVSTLSESSDDDTIINVVNPQYSDSMYGMSSDSADELATFIEESIRQIVSSHPKDQSEKVVMDFLMSFAHCEESQLAALVKRILGNEDMWQPPAVSHIIGSIEAHNEFVAQITAEAVGDLLHDYLRDPDKKCSALKQLHRYQADLRVLYYEKGCRLTQTSAKQAVRNALMHESNGTGCICMKGRGTNEEQLTDRDILALCVAVKLGLKISTLSIHHQSVTDFGVWHLAHMLKKNIWPLKHLDLRGNFITGNGATFLAEILMECNYIRTLILAENKIGNVGGLAINRALQQNTELIALDLSGTDLTMESIVALVVTVGSHPTLRYLDLSRPLLFSKQEEPMIHLGNTLKANRILKELHLQKFGLSDYGIKIFVQGLIQNGGLTHLDLSCNEIVWDGTRELAIFLQSNALLQVLNLHANRIEDPGAIDIADALANYNTTLKKLIVTNNNIERQGLCALVKSLGQNCALTNLHIWGNKLESTACLALAEVLHSGRLDPRCVDFSPYIVDGVTFLAKAEYPVTTHKYL